MDVLSQGESREAAQSPHAERFFEPQSSQLGPPRTVFSMMHDQSEGVPLWAKP